MSAAKIIILTGPTAVGKSKLALEAALELKKTGVHLEIINADSVSFYQHFNIGAAKPSLEEQMLVPHHLIDVAKPDLDNYHAAKFKEDVENTLTNIQSRKAKAIIVGGSGFYLNALLFGLWDAPETNLEFRKNLETIPNEILYQELQKKDPVHSKKISAQDRYRIIRALEIIETSNQLPSQIEREHNLNPDPRFSLWIMDRSKEDLESRILTRTKAMLSQGWIEETQELLKKYPQARALQSVGYAQVVAYLKGILPEGRKIAQGQEGLLSEVVLSHRQLAKNQRTWFKGLEKKLNEKSAHSCLVHNIISSSYDELKEKLITHYQS